MEKMENVYVMDHPLIKHKISMIRTKHTGTNAVSYTHLVAFFAVSSDGTITVRKPNDYVSSMIDLAGGVYSLNGYLEEEDNALSTLKMQMEDFYVAEKDADILIYNGTIEGELNSVDELIAKNSLFADFKAVQSGDAVSYTHLDTDFWKMRGISEMYLSVQTIIS